MRVEQIKIKNYKAFQEATLQGLGGLNVLVGNNASGKSTVLEVLDFLSDAMRTNATTAVNRRGGFNRLVSNQQSDAAIEIELQLQVPKESSNTYDKLIYFVKIQQDSNQIIVKQEVLKCYSTLMADERILLEIKDGFGNVANKKNGVVETILFELERRDALCIGIVGHVQGYPAVNLLRQMISGWYLLERPAQRAALAPTLQHLYQHQRVVLDQILQKLQDLLPDVGELEVTETEDGRVLLKTEAGIFVDPFAVGAVSEGTLQLLSYLLLLHSTEPHQLLGIEHPEQQLHADLLPALIEEFRAYAERGGQIFVTSHAPDLISALQLGELFRVQKEQGAATVHALGENAEVRARYETGEPLGRIWN